MVVGYIWWLYIAGADNFECEYFEINFEKAYNCNFEKCDGNFENNFENYKITTSLTVQVLGTVT